jgi:hypothetical protein
MLDLDKLNKLANQTVERIRRDKLEDDKILIHVGEIITEAVRQHAAWYSKLEQLQKAFALACRIIGDNHACPGCDLEDTDECKRKGSAAALSSWQCWQDYIMGCAETDQICRVCGCTDDNACEDGCSWAEKDLCSSCVGKEKQV